MRFEPKRPANAVRERPRAAADDVRHDEEMDVVHDPGTEGLRGEGGASDAEIGLRLGLHPLDPGGVEVALQPRVGRGDFLQRA